METSEANPKHETILDALPIGVCTLQAVRKGDTVTDFQWRSMNGFATNLLAPGESLVGKRVLKVSPELQDSDLFRALCSVSETRAPQRLEQSFPASASVTGHERWYTITIQDLAENLLLTFEDITGQKAIEHHIKQLAFQDELTGIYNRRYFLSRAPELIALAQREAWSCAIIFFDLNGFKEVNDTYGHKTGDKLLQEVAWRLSKASREGDIFFRSGGDEFSFFLPNATEKAALAAANRIRDELRRSFSIGGVEHSIGVSIGVAVMLSEDATVDKLLERADAAMYRAKEQKAQDAYAVVLWNSALEPGHV